MTALRLLAGTVAAQALQLIFIGCMVAALVFFGQRFGLFGESLSLAPTSAANFSDGQGRRVELFTLLPKDGIRSIDDPAFIRAADAEWPPSTPVIGVVVGRDARAYPLPVLAAHEIVNDVVGGLPLAVTYCPLCLTGIVFDRSVGGEVVEFGVSGKLLMNVLVMYDRASDSLWSQILGEAVSGPRKGEQLTVVDSLQTTWGTWQRLHPGTLMLDARVRNDAYAAYYRNGDSGVHGGYLDDGDERLPEKSVVLGLLLDRAARAYPLALGPDQGVINDQLGDAPVLIAFGRDGETAVAFDPRLDGPALRFDPHPDDPELMLDRGTASVWRRLTGEAVSGPLRGARLQRLTANTSFWFGWRDFFPQTTVYGVDVGP